MTDSISVSAIIADIAPYALALLPVAIGWLAAEVRAHTKVRISQAAVDKLDTLAKAEAGAMIAASETNLAGKAIRVSSPMVAEAANGIVDELPKVLAASGLTADHVATMIAGHVGAIRGSAPTAAPAGSATAAAA